MSEMMSKVCIGVDPGARGSMAIIHPDGGVDLFPWDDAHMYFEELEILDCRNFRPMAAIEHVNAMPGQGVTSMFNFGRNFGMVLGMFHTLRIPFELVRPQRWMKDFGISGDKNDHVAVARRLFPEVSLKRTPRCVKDDDGHADALLLAEWARRHFNG